MSVAKETGVKIRSAIPMIHRGRADIGLQGHAFSVAQTNQGVACRDGITAVLNGSGSEWSAHGTVEFDDRVVMNDAIGDRARWTQSFFSLKPVYCSCHVVHIPPSEPVEARRWKLEPGTDGVSVAIRIFGTNGYASSHESARGLRGLVVAPAE